MTWPLIMWRVLQRSVAQRTAVFLVDELNTALYSTPQSHRQTTTPAIRASEFDWSLVARHFTRDGGRLPSELLFKAQAGGFSELAVDSDAENIHGTAILVEGRVCDVLVVAGNPE